MSGDNDKNFFVNPFPILMVALLAAGVFVGPPELRSGRPADPERARFVPTTDQDVEARLWQDPLAAVEAAAEANKGPDGSRPAATNESDAGRYGPIHKHIARMLKKEGDRITILAVTVFGGSYTQAAENRRRSRFAVISALGYQRYQPERPDALGYVSFNLPKSADAAGEPSPVLPTYNNPILVSTHTDSNNDQYSQGERLVVRAAYEWFTRTPSQNKTEHGESDNVLVVWLNEDVISKNPQFYLKKIHDILVCDDLICNKHKSITFRLIGPNASDTLAHLIKERTEPDSAINLKSNNVLFDVFSPSATMSVKDLYELARVKDSGSPTALADLSIVRATDTDDHLAQTLIKELQLRGVGSRCEDGVILVHEADTNYSTTLSSHLRNSFCPSTTSNTVIHEFSYLRGIDGVLPGADKQEAPASQKDDADKSKDLRTQFESVRPEYAEGRNQSDYLRRLADQIVQLDHNPNFARNGIKAIGIVGNDVYDKLLILKALREQLRNKIFFTTDLDARYLHTDQKTAGRNLIVASNFDLTLHPKLQGSTLPFRDTYQTATYLATLMALEAQCPRCWSDKVAQWVRPQLFEIGRTQAIPLSPVIDNNDCRIIPSSDDNKKIFSWMECQNIDPIRPSSLPSFTQKTSLLLVAIVIGGILLLVLTVQSVRYLASLPIMQRVLPYISIIVLLMIGISCVIYNKISYSLEQGVGEPFFWLEGVSVWPSVILRFSGIAITIALAVFLKIRNDMQANEINTCFGLKIQEIRHSEERDHRPVTSQWTLKQNLWKWLWRGPHIDVTSFHIYAEKSDRCSKAISTLWRYYIYSTGWRVALPWVASSVLLMSLIGTAIVATLGPPSFPGRGDLVWWLNIISILLSILTVWFTVFWVVYETRACTGFINILSDMEEVQTGWAKSCKEIDKGVPVSPYRDAYLAFRLIVRTTQRVQRLIYLPFLSILFMVAARSNLFDALNFPLSLIVLNVVAAGYALSSAIRLRSGAKAAKENIIEQIENLRFAAPNASAPNAAAASASQQPTAEQIDLGLQRIRATREGAFAPLTEQPVLQAFLLPFGGFGGLQLIESLFSA